MTNFIYESACRGVKPKQVELSNKTIREDLISKMMSQRNVLRFIEAPNGYGKSELAAHYADLVFSFDNVFWINCISPCFIRDLDSLDIASEIIQIDPDCNLVVFDNFINLEEERNIKFNNIVDKMIEYGIEVVVIATPFNDSFLQNQLDCLLISSEELLINENDTEQVKKQYCSMYQIPIVLDNQNNGIAKLLENAVNEKLNISILLSLFYLYTFCSGSLENLRLILRKSDMNLLKDFNEKYHYFGIDFENDSFSVPKIPLKMFFSLFIKLFSEFMIYLNIDTRHLFFTSFVDMLEKEKKYNRIIEFSLCASDSQIKLTSLKKFNFNCIQSFFFGHAIELYDSASLRNKNSGLLSAFYSLQMAISGFNDKAIRSSYLVLDSIYSTIDNKLLACMVFMRYGSRNEKAQALKLIRCLYNDFKIDNYLSNNKIDSNDLLKCKIIDCMVKTYFSIFNNRQNPFKEWINSYNDKLNLINIICAEIIFNSWKQIEHQYFFSDEYNKFINIISRNFNNNQDEYDFFSFSLINSYIKFSEANNNFDDIRKWFIDDSIMDKYKFACKKFADEKEYIKNLNNKSYDSNNLYEKTNKLIKLNNAYIENSGEEQINYPVLNINVFGGLKASLGDRDIISTSFGRQNVKLICCILVLEKGNEISKMKLAQWLWPNADEKTWRLNMNSLWSELRKIFSLPDGKCPYLIRNQNSYKLNKSLVTSDLDMFEKICNELTLGRIEAQSWWELIEANENIISGELLPSENNCKYIVNKRHVYCQKIVDSLVAASQRLLDSGQVAQALWFAKNALSRDANREDVYLMLMKIQMQAGQRTPAIETYMACKKFLENNLGLKPSQELLSLYENAVQTN